MPGKHPTSQTPHRPPVKLQEEPPTPHPQAAWLRKESEQEFLLQNCGAAGRGGWQHGAWDRGGHAAGKPDRDGAD